MEWTKGTMKNHLRQVREKAEVELYIEALEFTGGNVSYTADILGLSRKQVQLRLKALGLDPVGYRSGFKYRTGLKKPRNPESVTTVSLLELKKKNAASMVTKALDLGLIHRPDKCEKCFAPSDMIEAHHPDYDKPLEIQWLCSGCHGKVPKQPTEKPKQFRRLAKPA
jgi:hypothetical protein